MDLREIKSHDHLRRVTRKGLALVTLGAPWCAPCLLQEPILRRVARRFEGRAILATADIDENPGLARALGIQSIPTLLVFRNGMELQRLVGLQPEGVLAGALASLLEPVPPQTCGMNRALF